MIYILDIGQSQEWDRIVESFIDYDVYYLSGYVKAFMIHGDGMPYLLYFEEGGLRAMYVFMMRHTGKEGVYDSITPYGYGGVLFAGDITEEKRNIFRTAYLAKMKEMNIIDNFVRYHPVLSNAVYMKDLSNVIDLGKTIAMDLTSPEIIWSNFCSRNRNKIRKAQKNGIEIHHGKGLELFRYFRNIYDSTMKKDNAEEYYFFGDGFYESIHNDLHDNYEMFWATCQGTIAAMSILLFANGRLNYHLSGSLSEYRHLAPTNLLLYQAALWGYEQGMKTFHLGGGLGSEEDDLYMFKKAFNRNSDYQFSIGKEVFDQQQYDELVAAREASDPTFDKTRVFFPTYRA